MKKYEVGFVFFVESANVADKDRLLDELDLIDEVTSYDVTDDGEDWNIECVAEIESKATKNIDEAIDKKLRKLLPNVCWDYHYVKGIDNDYHWQPGKKFVLKIVNPLANGNIIITLVNVKQINIIMDETADELAYKRYLAGEYTYEEYLVVCDIEETTPMLK